MQNLAGPPDRGYELSTRSTETIAFLPSIVPTEIRLTNPLMRVTVSNEDGDGVFLVTDSFSSTYGAGESPELALSDYANNLIDLFVELDRDEAILGPSFQQELRRLREHFVRVR